MRIANHYHGTFQGLVLWKLLHLLFVVICLLASVLGHEGLHSHSHGTIFNITRDANGCTTVIHTRNRLLHKPTYRVGVYASEGDQVAHDMYDKVFGTYLTATVGQKFHPPVQFEVVPVLLRTLMELAEEESVDFLFASSAVFSCMATEYKAQPLVTIINRRESRGYAYDLDVYGGVMFVMADNDEVNSIQDFKNKTIGAGAITAMGGGQTQFYELFKHGLSYVSDPRQVIFTGDERLVVQGLLDGDFEIGFARTDQIERHTNERGELVRDDTFKIINPQTHVLDDGRLFPFVSSTGLHPEWPVAALDHVARIVSKEVQEALLAIGDHAMSLELGDNLRCDTTSEIAKLAAEARSDGSFSGFRTARSYFEVRTKQETAGFIKLDKGTGNLHCIRGDTFYQDIECPVNYYKVTEEEFEKSCQNARLECKEGYECFCQPCVKAFEVDVFQYDNAVEEDIVMKQEGCEKMSLCGQVQQRKNITLLAVDNLKRENPRVSVIVHLRDEDVQLPVIKFKSHSYLIHWSYHQVGVGIMEIFFDDVQIPESPLRLAVVERQCDIDFPGRGMVAAQNGQCQCGDGTVEVGRKCVDVAMFYVGGSMIMLVIILIVTLFYVRFRNRKSDEMWTVHTDELHFDDPAEIIGQGSFGVVLLAEYRGTKVAVKRVTKKNTKSGSSKTSNHRKNNDSATFEGIHVTQDRRNGNVPKEVLTNSSNSSPNEVNDIESAPENDSRADLSRRSREVLDSVSKLSFHFSVGFLTKELYQSKGTWASLVNWKSRERIEKDRLHHEILGAESASATPNVIRFLCPWFDEDARRREDFKTEMRVLARLRHPCITTVMGAVINKNLDPVMVMEYMEYGSLHDLLRNETAILSGEIILQITRDLAQGLRFLHSSKPPILHGDLKARNILIDSRFRAKLCDFGLSSKTTNKISGTPFWLAPEYLMGLKQYDPACDIYSVGIILFEIFSRKSPYEGEDYRQVIRDVCNRRVNKRPIIPAETPPKFADLMKKCWSPDVHYRPQARTMDMMLMDMNVDDAEPVKEEQQIYKKRAGDLLNDIFPKHVAEALKKGQKVEPEKHDMVTVIFSDIISFTDISKELGAEKVCDMLDRLYVKFDSCARKHNVFKVETIGDAWMGVTNLEQDQNHNHVKQIAEYAIDMVNSASQVLIDTDNPDRGFVKIRVGFHSGPVVSNVIGSLNKRYCLFGDTVNTASRMESNSMENRILCSERSYRLLKEQAPEIATRRRGKIEVKGKGQMVVYWVGDTLLAVRRAARRRSVAFEDNTNSSFDEGLLEDFESVLGSIPTGTTTANANNRGDTDHSSRDVTPDNSNDFISDLNKTINSLEEDLERVSNELTTEQVPLKQ